MANEAAPLILSALFGAEDFAWLDGLRRTYFPPERNHIAAHLTMFHHLPPSIEDELRRRLMSETDAVGLPDARVTGPLKLGRGTALRVACDDLVAIRGRLADAFAECLTPQDQAGFRPHVTIQNKVDPAVALALYDSMAAFVPRPLAIAGLAVWRYRGGPWEPVSRHMFNRSARSRRS